MPRPVYDLLLIDSDPQILEQLSGVAHSHQWTFVALNSSKKALEMLDQALFRVIVCEMNLEGISGLQLLEWVKSRSSSSEFLVMTSDARATTAVRAMKLGAFDYLLKPFENLDKVAFEFRQALEKQQLFDRLTSFQEQNNNPSLEESIIGKSSKMQAIYELIRQVAPSSSNVLIYGESGTGKELVARAIHRNGPRSLKPFTVINCAAMPETLLEAELFGYTKGSFTGAHVDKIGLFEQASGGTIFLDEVGEISLATQVKLLRVLQEGEIRRIGDTQSTHIDVRVIAASNKDLIQLTQEGKFREDLYFRLNVIGIGLPPLRERKEDIMLLAYHFLSRISKSMGKEVGKMSLDFLEALQHYNWPGNVRELENTIERAVVFAEGDTLISKHLPAKILSSSFYQTPHDEQDLSEIPYQEAKKRALNIFHRSYIVNLLKKAGGNITLASEKAGLDRSNFKKIIRKYRIDTKKDL